MTMPLVTASKHEGVMVLELRNPPANTYSYEMMRELDAHILDARMDESVHVLMLTGAPPPPDAKKPIEFFCAGADIAMLQGANPYFKYNFCLHANETLCTAGADAQAGDRGRQRALRGRGPGGGAGLRPAHRACRRRARWGCPRFRSACCRAPEGRSDWRVPSANPRPSS